MVNEFSLSYYKDILWKASINGYQFFTLRDYVKAGFPKEKALILRHDLDLRPQTLQPILDAERVCGACSTIYVRVAGAEYNFMGYQLFPVLHQAEHEGFEIGLHTNFVEFAKLTNVDPYHVVGQELRSLHNFFTVSGIAGHRDFNYAYNSLPFIQTNWEHFKQIGFEYEAYDQRFMDNAVFVNEGMKPHLTWRDKRPEDVLETGKSVYLTTHPHWWWDKHPHEGHV